MCCPVVCHIVFSYLQNFRHRIVGYEERGYVRNDSFVYTTYNRNQYVLKRTRKHSSNLIEVRNGTRILHIGNKTYILGKASRTAKQMSDSTNTTAQANGYSIMLTSVCFVHHIYFEMFFDPLFVPSGVLQFTDEKRNCEDILLSILVTKFLHDISWPQCGVLAVKASFGITNLDKEASKILLYCGVCRNDCIESYIK